MDPIATSPCVCLHVRKLGRQLSQIYDHFLRPAGIRSTQYGLLKCVETLYEPFISDIGRALSMDQTTVTRNVEKLERQGLVETKTHPSDSRKKMVALTPSGTAKLLEAHPLWQNAQDHVRSHIGEDNRSDLLRLLQEASTAIKEP